MTVKPGVRCDVDEKAGEHVWSDRSRRMRCPLCSKKLTTYAVYDYLEPDIVLGFRLPPHKTKSKTYKRPKVIDGASGVNWNVNQDRFLGSVANRFVPARVWGASPLRSVSH